MAVFDEWGLGYANGMPSWNLRAELQKKLNKTTNAKHFLRALLFNQCHAIHESLAHFVQELRLHGLPLDCHWVATGLSILI